MRRWCQVRWSRGRLVFGGDALGENRCICRAAPAISGSRNRDRTGPIILDWLLARRWRQNGRNLCKPQGHPMQFLKQIDAATRRTGLAGVTRRVEYSPPKVLPHRCAPSSTAHLVSLTFRDYDWGREHRGTPDNALSARLQRGPCLQHL